MTRSSMVTRAARSLQRIHSSVPLRTSTSSSTTTSASAFTTPTTSPMAPTKRPAAAAPGISAPATPPTMNPFSTFAHTYRTTTPSRTKLIDAFLGFLMVVGVLQFAYCVVAGNYPFNAFLAGFSATVGQFVLTVSLRMQSDKGNAGEFKAVGPERAFADYVFGSVLLHFFCVNFIN